MPRCGSGYGYVVKELVVRCIVPISIQGVVSGCISGCSAHFNTRGRCYVEVVVVVIVSISGLVVVVVVSGVHVSIQGFVVVDSGVHISIQVVVVVSGVHILNTEVCGVVVSGCSKWFAHFNTRDRCYVEVVVSGVHISIQGLVVVVSGCMVCTFQYKELVLRCGCSKWWAHFNARVSVRGVHISIQGVEYIGWLKVVVKGCISGVNILMQRLEVVVRGCIRGCIIGVHISIQGLEVVVEFRVCIRGVVVSGVQISILGFNAMGRCYVEVVVVHARCYVAVVVSGRCYVEFNTRCRCYVEFNTRLGATLRLNIERSVLLQYKGDRFYAVLGRRPYVVDMMLV
ncbi:hypothetical protein DPMN_104808 [Dreissena polymorpha]|uniref:Uncharacterized protein n=1 Tax=Dreissena polymorpha TaxID=45954 RepID=A0A9D4HCP3_DREPO|nr:hypothetical protein DPMN_104808 [Dreissena polymorpha]